MAVRVGNVEIVLAPFRVARGKLGLQALRHGVPSLADALRMLREQAQRTPPN